MIHSYSIPIVEEEDDGSYYLFFEVQTKDPRLHVSDLHDDKIEIIEWCIERDIRVAISTTAMGFCVHVPDKDAAFMIRLHF